MIRAAVLAGVLALGVACSSPQEKAADIVEDFEPVFETCRTLSSEAEVAPGTHYCSKLASIALERALDEAELDEAARDAMIEAWVRASELGAYYADEPARAAIPDL